MLKLFDLRIYGELDIVSILLQSSFHFLMILGVEAVLRPAMPGVRFSVRTICIQSDEQECSVIIHFQRYYPKRYGR